jgi:hypothetical protein
MVPAYIEAGERIRVDTRDGRFVERAPLRNARRTRSEGI